ncbi:MAG: Crp/Fnr family transcriptional regulator [Alphaproteobacteria bacterium]|nr:MAG: Crp/Fnr family transcriptional regulator [Alphaproteobacteria bacterium]
MTMITRPASDKRELLSRHFLLKDLDVRTLDRIVHYSLVRSVSEGSVIFSQGDLGECLYGILRGRVRIFNNSPENREILLNILEPGALFGEIALLDDRPRTANASAMEDCELLTMHRQHFIPLLEEDPRLAIHMLGLLCARVRWTSSIIEDTTFLNLPARFAKRLLALAHSHGEKLPDGERIRINLRLSQRQIGAMIDASREAVNKQIQIWRADGILDLDDGFLVLRRPDWLEAIVG